MSQNTLRRLTTLCFAIAVATGWALPLYGRHVPLRDIGIPFLLAATVFLAIAVLSMYPRTLWLYSAVATALLLANWHYAEGILMLTLWSVLGFAP